MIDKNKLIAIQEDLCKLVACPGRESLVAEYVYNTIKPHVDTVTIDTVGNVIAIKNGKNKDGKKLLLDAHMDEVGFMVNHIDTSGFIKVAPMGGIDTSNLPGTPVQFINTKGKQIIGVFCNIPPHLAKQNENAKKPEFDDLSIDLGVSSNEDVKKKNIEVGCYGTFFSPFIAIDDSMLMGKAFDNRCGCAVALYIAQLLSNESLPNTIAFNFSIMEEHRQLGAGTGAASINPDIALVIEGTTATDTAGVPESKIIASLNSGAAITIADGTHIVPQKLIDKIIHCAKANNIKWQYKKPIFGGTNAGEIAKTASGIPTAIIAVPCRYIHGPNSILHIEDLTAVTKLVYFLSKEIF